MTAADTIIRDAYNDLIDQMIGTESAYTPEQLEIMEECDTIEYANAYSEGEQSGEYFEVLRDRDGHWRPFY